MPLTSRRALAVVTALATTAALAPLTAPPALAAPQRDVVVKSFDGTPIVVHFFPADGLSKGERAPVVMVAHGYGEKGPATRDEVLVGGPSTDALLKSGYNVLTWDARGHGGSGGTAKFDSPDFEVRDTRKLIDWAARQPEVKLDAKGDPRLGMAGASYGGIIQFNTAAADRRVDVISPSYTGHSLSDDMIAPRGKFKETWASFLVVATAQTVPPGVISPAGPQVHTPDPEAVNGLLSGAATGQLSDEFRAYLDANRVVGGQITPIPVKLDGEQHTVTQEFEAIATRAKRSSRYQLQILPGSMAFGQQRSTGVVQLHSVKATLPMIDPLG